MDIVILFLICLVASIIGVISGIGGGVIIKPLAESMKLLDISTLGFLSGCAVITMAGYSIIRGRGEIAITKGLTIPLVLGGTVGGIMGKSVFNILISSLGQPSQVGVIQNGIMLGLNGLILIYLWRKKFIKKIKLSHSASSFGIGLGLGIVSSFLGIGGGPFNVAAIYLFFDLPPKQSALHSLLLVFASQFAALLTTLGRLPEFSPMALIWMCVGALSGALIGRTLSTKLKEAHVERFYAGVVVIIMGINFFNILPL